MNLLFRCDASKNIGSGHAMRCLALAQEAAQKDARIVFAMSDVSPGIAARIQHDGFAIKRIDAAIGSARDRELTVQRAREEHADWIALDGYRFDGDFQRVIVDAGVSRVLTFDDYGQADFYSAHLILNQNLGADERLYARRAPHTKLLLGASYALLRREFQRWRDWRRDYSAGANRVLISLGGSDPQNVTLDILRALEDTAADALELDVIAGAANEHLDTLEKMCHNSRHKATLTVNASDMDERMARAHVAITAGGSTCWELCLMQLPALVVLLTPDQEFGGAKLAETGAVLNMGFANSGSLARMPAELNALAANAAARERMGRTGRTIVDGRGAQRACEAMKIAKNNP